MKLRRLLISLLLMLINLPGLFADDSKLKNVKAQKTLIHDKKIVILPLYNYSDSTFKYLSTYIPELIASYLSLYSGIEVYDPKSLRKEIGAKGLTPEMLYYEDRALKFLHDVKADIGINGRYIIHDKNIIIDFKVIYVHTGKFVDGDNFEGIIDENLLVALDRFARSRTEWFVNNILSKIISKLKFKDKSRSEKYISRIQESRIGRFVRNKWVFASLIIISFYLLSKLDTLFFKRYFPIILGFANGAIDEIVIRKFRKSLNRIIILFGFKLSLVILELSPATYDLLNDIITAFIIAFVVYAFIIIIEASLRFWGEGAKDKFNPRVNRDLMPLFVSFTKVLIVTIGIIIILSKFDIDVGPFIASIGIMGIAIGFAVKDSLADIIGGIFLALDHSIAAGDMVTIEGDTGFIKEVGLRNTKLLTFDNEIIVIPNSELSGRKYKNYVLPDPTFRVIVDFSVVYGTDVDKVEEIVVDRLINMENVAPDPPPDCVFEEMADFSLNFRAKFWISSYQDKLIKKKEATKEIYKALNESDIAIPFPTRTVYIKND